MRSIIGTAPGTPRAPFNSAPLVRLLAGLAPGAAGAGAGGAGAAAAGAATDNRGSLAERLGQWLDWTDAMALSAALNSPATQPPSTVAGAGQAARGLRPAAALARVQADLAKAITGDSAFQPGTAPGNGLDDSPDFAPYRRACQAHQRAMAAATSALRAQLRQVLAASSPALARLAAIDATLDAAFGERERHLLGAVVQRLAQRFEALHQAQPPGWLALFHADMQRTLLAELDLRLQPAQGLLDALQASPAGSTAA